MTSTLGGKSIVSAIQSVDIAGYHIAHADGWLGGSCDCEKGWWESLWEEV